MRHDQRVEGQHALARAGSTRSGLTSISATTSARSWHSSEKRTRPRPVPATSDGGAPRTPSNTRAARSRTERRPGLSDSAHRRQQQLPVPQHFHQCPAHPDRDGRSPGGSSSHPEDRLDAAAAPSPVPARRGSSASGWAARAFAMISSYPSSSASASSTPSSTAPASVLWSRSGDSTFSATGQPEHVGRPDSIVDAERARISRVVGMP